MSEFYKFDEIRPNVYHIESAEQVFLDLFVGTEKALLFDTGYGFGDLKGRIRQITELPLIVVNSHGHLDHACGNFKFDEPVYIHPDDIELCVQSTSEQVRRSAIENAKHTQDFVSGVVSNILPEGFCEEAYCREGTGNLIPVREGAIFSLGGITLKVIEVPGHTAGSIGLHYEEKNMFFAGDAMNSFLWLFLPESKMLSDYIATLKKIKTLGISSFVIGHYPLVLDAKTLDAYLDVAENLDFEKGEPFVHPQFPVTDARVCIREGYCPEDMMKPGFASIVISKEHIN